MNITALLLRTILEDPSITQRKLAAALGISLGNVNKQIKTALDSDCLSSDGKTYALTETGLQFLDKFRVSNAVIIAAGFGSRFVPLTYETPKGLLEVFGEPMIERQIKQLKEAGISDITIVVGYLKEKFDYLIDKYGVKLLYNPEYLNKNTVATLYHARHLFKNTYLLASDNWLRENPYHAYEAGAWYSASYMEGKTSEWCLITDKKNKIREVAIGGQDSYVMYGPAYFDETFSRQFIFLLEEHYERPGTENDYWEQILLENTDKLTMYINKQPENMVYEFENLEELRLFDEKYQNHSENLAMEKISHIFSVPESEITNIKCLKAGMTNKSFLFSVKAKDYIFRIPGPGTDHLINRAEEKACYDAIKDLQLSDRIIYFDGENGYKISRYYENSRNCDPKNRSETAACMRVLKKFHQTGVRVDHEFNLRERIQFYEALCMENKSIQFQDYTQTRLHMDELLELIESMDIPKVLSHIDSVFANFLILPDDSIRLIDWEYAAMCDPLIDIAMFAIYAYYNEQETNQLISDYLEREANQEETLRIYSYIALSGFLWALWAEYKSSLGEEFGDYTLKMYRYAKDYYKKVLLIQPHDTAF